MRSSEAMPDYADVMADEEQPDVRRLMAAAAKLKSEGEKATIPNLANALKWPMGRTHVAVASGFDRGWLTEPRSK